MIVELGRRNRIAGWTALLAIMILAGTGAAKLVQPAAEGSSAALDLVRYFTRSTENVTLTHVGNFMKVRDPVYLQNADGTIKQVGYVLRIKGPVDQPQTVIRWYEDKIPAMQCEMVAHQNSGRLEDLIEMMFPPEKRQRIEGLIMSAMQQHGQQLSARLVPILERAMRDSLPAIETGFRESIARHRVELDALAVRWQTEIIEGRLVPLAKNEIVPIVRRNGEPVAQVIGRQLWDRASIWSFTWRAIYDKTPLPQRDLMKQEWDRFVDEEAIPIFEEHASEIALAIQNTMVEVSQNENVRAEFASAADAIAKDPEARKLVQVILRESMVDNMALRKVWADAWTSDEAKAAIQDAGRALEPTIRKIGDELMGRREKGIDPGFAKLLRNQVLQKDQRWIMATRIP